MVTPLQFGQQIVMQLLEPRGALRQRLRFDQLDATEQLALGRTGAERARLGGFGIGRWRDGGLRCRPRLVLLRMTHASRLARTPDTRVQDQLQ